MKQTVHDVHKYCQSNTKSTHTLKNDYNTETWETFNPMLQGFYRFLDVYSTRPLSDKLYIGQIMFCTILAPPAPQPAGIMNNGAKDVTKDIQKLQQQLQDIKDQVTDVSTL